MGKRITTWLDRVFDSIHWKLVGLGWRDPEASSAADFFIFLALVSLVLSVHPLFCYAILSRDPHVVFWMDPQLRQLTLLEPAVLLALLCAMLLLYWVQLRPHIVRGLIFVSFVIAGGVIACAGVYIFQASQDASSNLVYHCGDAGTMTQAIEKEWFRLLQFQRNCAEVLGQRLQLQACPGFAEAIAAPHTVFAGYMQELETDFGCSGFCRFWASPLFNLHSADTGQRCASALGERMFSVGTFAGLPMLASGVLLEVLGALMVGYDHI